MEKILTDMVDAPNSWTLDSYKTRKGFTSLARVLEIDGRMKSEMARAKETVVENALGGNMDASLALLQPAMKVMVELTHGDAEKAREGVRETVEKALAEAVAQSGSKDDPGAYVWSRLQVAMQLQAGMQVIGEVKKANLRGRGGAGFPAGIKWGFLPRESDVPKYLVTNADEGEPGTFKDRMIMDLNPHQLLEGCIMTAWTLNLRATYIYIRGEMVHEAKRLEAAVEELLASNWLGDNIQGSGLQHDIYVHRGAGAYICGEETALIESLEGKAGQPRLKPPFPAVVGVFSCPTVVNNVETIACIPTIVTRGGSWWFQESRWYQEGLKAEEVAPLDESGEADLVALVEGMPLDKVRQDRQSVYTNRIEVRESRQRFLLDPLEEPDLIEELKEAQEREMLLGERIALLEEKAGYRKALLEHRGGGGPKMVALSGHVRNPGVFEVPHGYSLKDLIYSPEYGGGMRPGPDGKPRKLKGVIPGGASCPVLLPDMIDVGLDFASMTVPRSKGGPESMLGTACATVMDETTCMVRVAANLAHFFHHESCGQCTPCREGTGWVARVLDDIEAGKATPDDLDLLFDVCNNIEGNTICPFGDAVAMAVRSYIVRFPDDFTLHVEQKGCPYPKW